MDGSPLPCTTEQLLGLLAPTSLPETALSALRPDFLIISPPKTGSTWLSANFRCHPQLFVPEVKEVKYFSSLYKWLDLGWYLDHFLPGKDRIKGEASPSYSLLPSERIRLVRSLFPQVKLIYLMREPISRAWSHARHNYRYREANFAACRAEFEQVSAQHWLDNFAHLWPLASGDYLAQLQRWLDVFPREQLFLGFYEDIIHQPETLLRCVFRFLKVDDSLDLAGFPVRERIFAGVEKPLPEPLKRQLHALLDGRTRQLQRYLENHFSLKLPAEWQSAEDGSTQTTIAPPAWDSLCPVSVLAQEEDFLSGHRCLFEEYLGFRILYYRRRLLAVARTHWPIDLADQSTVQRLMDQGHCFEAQSVQQLKERLLQARAQQQTQQYQTLAERVEQLHQELSSLHQVIVTDRQRITALERSLWEAGQTVQHLETQLTRLRPWYRILGRALVHRWQQLVAWWFPTTRSTLDGGWNRAA